MKKTYTKPCCTVVMLNAKENLMQPSLTEKTASREILLNDPYSGGGSGYAREDIRSRYVWAEDW